MEEEVPGGCHEKWGTLKFQGRLQVKSEGRNSLRNGPLGQLIKAGKLVVGEEGEE